MANIPSKAGNTIAMIANTATLLGAGFVMSQKGNALGLKQGPIAEVAIASVAAIAATAGLVNNFRLKGIRKETMVEKLRMQQLETEIQLREEQGHSR